jgi:hypothetical protein
MGVLIAGVVTWIAFGGLDSVRQVFTFRGATGWQIESSVGVTIWSITGGPIRLDAGALRVGHVPGWTSPLLAATLLSVVGAIWWSAYRHRERRIGVPCTAVLCALLTLSPIFSLQYAMWLIPFGALAWVEGEAFDGRAAFTVSLMTGVLTAVYVGSRVRGWDPSEIAILLIVTRNAVCAIVPTRHLWLSFRRGPAGVPAV